MDSPEVPLLLLDLAPPSDCGLLHWLRDRVSRSMIEEISRNDRGEEALEHLMGIVAQLTGDAPLGLIAWTPREVLELERWNEPDRPYGDEPPSGRHGHLKRLLACTLLLQNVAHVNAAHGSEEEYFVETSAATLIQLIRSVIVIGGEGPSLATGFLLWVYGSQNHAAFRPFAAASVFLLTASISAARFPGLDLGNVWAWVLAVEDQSRTIVGNRIESERWLIGLNSYEDRDGHRDKWADLAKSMLASPTARYPTEAKHFLYAMCERVAE